MCLHLRGSACLYGLVGAASFVVVQPRYHGILVAIVVLECIQILTVQGPLRLSHLPRPLQPHLSLLLSVKFLLVFPLLFKLLGQCLLFLLKVKVDRTLSDGRLIHLLGREVRRLLLVPLLMHLDLQRFIMLLESLAPVLLLELEGASHLIIDLPRILNLPERLLHLSLPLGPLDRLHVPVTNGLLELMLPQLAVLHGLLLLVSLHEVDVIGNDFLKLLLLILPLLTLLDFLFDARDFHKFALL